MESEHKTVVGTQEYNVPERIVFNRWKTQWNGKRFPREFEKVGRVSKTIPDQALSVKELLQRHASGLSLGGEKVPVYHGEDDFLPDYRNLDLSEREDLKRATYDEIEKAKNKLNEEGRERQRSEKSRLDKNIQSDKGTDKGTAKNQKNDVKKDEESDNT